jgi:hypothetical protein
LIDAGLATPLTAAVPSWRQLLLQQRAQMKLAQLRPDEAFSDLMAAAAAVPSYDGALAGAALLASNEQPALALRFLDAAARPEESSVATGPLLSRLRMAWLRHTNYYPHEIAVLRETIEQDLMVQSARRGSVN